MTLGALSMPDALSMEAPDDPIDAARDILLGAKHGPASRGAVGLPLPGAPAGRSNWLRQSRLEGSRSECGAAHATPPRLPSLPDRPDGCPAASPPPTSHSHCFPVATSVSSNGPLLLDVC